MKLYCLYTPVRFLSRMQALGSKTLVLFTSLFHLEQRFPHRGLSLKTCQVTKNNLLKQSSSNILQAANDNLKFELLLQARNK